MRELVGLSVGMSVREMRGGGNELIFNALKTENNCMFCNNAFIRHLKY